MQTSRWRAVLLAAVCFPLTGCPDLSEVQKLAQAADGGKDSARVVAYDFVGSCDRRNQMVDTLPGEPVILPCPAPLREDEVHLAKNLVVEQDVLLDYFDALGKLSAADAVGFEKATTGLSTNFANAGFDATQQDMAQAAGKLAAAVTRLATLAYREKEIAAIITANDENVTKLANGLANQIATDKASLDPGYCRSHFAENPPSYFGELCNEEGVLSSFYEIPLAAEKDFAIRRLLQAQYAPAQTQLRSRKEAAIAYRTLMIQLAVTHHKLVVASQEGFSKDSVQRLANELTDPLTDIVDAVKTLRKDAK